MQVSYKTCAWILIVMTLTMVASAGTAVATGEWRLLLITGLCFYGVRGFLR